MDDERRFGEGGGDEGLGAANLNTLGTAPAGGAPADPRLGDAGGGPDPDGPGGPPDPTSRDAQMERSAGPEDRPTAGGPGPGGTAGTERDAVPAGGDGAAGSGGAAGADRVREHAADRPITSWQHERDAEHDGDIPPPG
ncbi:MAG TPA: hypothetical protein VNT51_08330 [Miltoncostaeaceae bacterium]|nr:hypothetical protein [Miltoncostaeaceae bacterium]